MGARTLSATFLLDLKELACMIRFFTRESKGYSLYFVRFSRFLEEFKLCSEVIFSPHFLLKISKHFAKISKHNAYYDAILCLLVYPYHGDGGHCLLPTTDDNIKNVYSLYGSDVEDIPAYNILQASRHIKIPFETLRSWTRGRTYPIGKDGERRLFQPVIKLPDSKRPLLSFTNMIEAHVLDGMRRQYSVPFYRIRDGLAFLEEKYPSKHPLADWLFQTNGVDLFVERMDNLINISQNGQLVMKGVVGAFLHRIERNLDGKPARLYPFINKPKRIGDRDINRLEQQPRPVVIDPFVSFGKPILVGTGIPTAIIAERFQAGESIEDLSEDYDLTPSQIEKAIWYEYPAREAA